MYVLLSSLVQEHCTHEFIARSKWVTTMFPKFSVKTRSGKTPEVTPPPHTTKAHGKYDLHVGPHVYHDTAIYEVHYLPAVEPIAEGLQSRSLACPHVSHSSDVAYSYTTAVFHSTRNCQ